MLNSFSFGFYNVLIFFFKSTFSLKNEPTFKQSHIFNSIISLKVFWMPIHTDLCIPKVEVDGFGMPNVEDSIWFWWKTGVNLHSDKGQILIHLQVICYTSKRYWKAFQHMHIPNLCSYFSPNLSTYLPTISILIFHKILFSHSLQSCTDDSVVIFPPFHRDDFNLFPISSRWFLPFPPTIEMILTFSPISLRWFLSFPVFPNFSEMILTFPLISEILFITFPNLIRNDF